MIKRVEGKHKIKLKMRMVIRKTVACKKTSFTVFVFPDFGGGVIVKKIDEVRAVPARCLQK